MRAVILDWAGTLVDHGSMAPVEALRDVFGATGLELTDAQARGPMGMGKRQHIEALLGDEAIAEAWSEQHGRRPAPDDIDRLYAAFAASLAGAVARHADVIDGVAEAVRQARAAGLLVGTTTGYPRAIAETVRHLAEDAGLVVDDLVAVDDVPEGRPAPWMILRTLERLRVFPPAHVVKIGDTGPDMAEARNAGVWAVGVWRTGNGTGLSEAAFRALASDEQARLSSPARRRLEQAGAHLFVASAAEMPTVVEEVEARLSRGERP